MQNPFTAHQQFESKPKRNAFDNSHRCFMTGKLGCLYPVMNLEVSAGDSVQIDSSFLFNFFPMKFPVQTPLRASIYFFYGRNRIFWKNWMDFAYNNKQPSHPYILQPNGNFWKTGSLADFLGVPTTYSSLGETTDYLLSLVPHALPEESGVTPRRSRHFIGNSIALSSYASFFVPGFTLQDYVFEIPDNSHYWTLLYDLYLTKENYLSSFAFGSVPDSWNDIIYNSGDTSSCGRWTIFADYGEDDPLDGSIVCISASENTIFNKLPNDARSWLSGSSSSFTLQEIFENIWLTRPNARFRVALSMSPSAVELLFPESFVEPLTRLLPANFAYSITGAFGQASTVDLSVLGSNPFSGSSQHAPRIPLNAIPFRFYEAVYNAYFRNERNDPFMVNGEIEYNKWNTTLEDGADSTPYKLYFRNWEADFLTTATQTPQQGLAPLVGINVRGDMEFLNEDGTISRIRPTIAEDGTTITGIAGVVENGTKEAMRSAMELITSGISINDFRQVSSLQSWLENNLRKGLKYKDQVAANTGVKIRYDELDMPEFIGGFSRPVQVTSITQATPSTAVDNALGDRAGQASVFGGSNHKISHYCDEAGYIMAIMCVYPQPVYTQLLPKYFLKSDALSYYHPQFGSIGLQPISYREVCPVQVFLESGDLDATFGYQRPWYDLIANVDEAHGNMRTNMRDYLMHRTFAGIPMLGRDFLKIDPEQLNDVFTITDGTEDVYQGQIAFNIFTKRAIPRFGIPRQI